MQQRKRSILVLLLAAVGTAVVGFWPAPSVDWIPLLAGGMLLSIGTLASPAGGSGLGAGALLVGLLVQRGGLLAAAVVSGSGASLGAALLRRAEPAPGNRRALDVATTGGVAVLSVLVAGSWLNAMDPRINLEDAGASRWLGAALSFGGCAAVSRRWLTPHTTPPAKIVAACALDAVALACGAAILTLARGPVGLWLPLGAVYVGLCLAAGRERRRALLHVLDRDRLERLSWARQRLSAASGDLGAVAEQLFRECRRATGCAHYQLDIESDANGGRVWHAGPEGEMLQGEACPPEHPPALPGIHRRARWQLVERALLAGDSTLGRLRLWCDPRRLQPDQLALLDDLLPQLQSSLAHALLDRQAKEDPLTGAALRRVLDVRLEASFRTARDGGRPLSVGLLDLDHFKRLNDTHGHAAGDRALVAVAGAIRAELRAEDLLARYGGEEFALVLDALTGEEAMQVSERLRQRIAAIALEIDGSMLGLSASVGVVSFPAVHVRQGGELLELADEALYACKEGGRNRCLLYLGPQRYRTPDGEILGTSERRVDAPRIF